MATSWTNPIASGSPIRAFDVQDVINAIDSNRSAAGLPPYPWTDPTISAGTPIKAVHFTEMRAATQDLWNTKGMGQITPWWAYGLEGQGPASGKPIYAQDLLDVRRWVNQYEDAPATVTVDPKKGMHLPAGGDGQFRQVDAWALEEAIPSFGMLVALDDHLDRSYQTQNGNTVTMATVMNWYATYRGTELFTRVFPTYGPVAAPPGWSSAYQEGTINDVVDALVAVRKTRGANFRRFLPGNEPNLEWPGVEALSSPPRPTYSYHDWQGNSVSWQTEWEPGKWEAMNAWYAEVLNELNRRKALPPPDPQWAPGDIELYYPSMAQGHGAEGKEQYCDDGTVTSRLLSDGSVGYDHLKVSIEGQAGYTAGYQRFSWHDYFFSQHAYEGSVVRYFPQWLQDDLFITGYPSRITEAGWWPGDEEHRDRDSPAGTYTQYKCDGSSAGSFSETTYPLDMEWFITQSRDGQPPASGTAVWLLSSLDAQFDRHVAVRAEQRPWYQSFKLWQPS